MSYSEHEHEHGEHGHAERHSKHTGFWLIVTILAVCIAVPLLILALNLPKSP